MAKDKANTIHGDRIFTNSITAGKIQAGAIGTSELAADLATADKIWHLKLQPPK